MGKLPRLPEVKDNQVHTPDLGTMFNSVTDNFHGGKGSASRKYVDPRWHASQVTFWILQRGNWGMLGNQDGTWERVPGNCSNSYFLVGGQAFHSCSMFISFGREDFRPLAFKQNQHCPCTGFLSPAPAWWRRGRWRMFLQRPTLKMPSVLTPWMSSSRQALMRPALLFEPMSITPLRSLSIPAHASKCQKEWKSISHVWHWAIWDCWGRHPANRPILGIIWDCKASTIDRTRQDCRFGMAASVPLL